MLTQGEKDPYAGQWSTPPEFLIWLQEHYGEFDLDLAAEGGKYKNAVCKHYFTDNDKGGALSDDCFWNCTNGFFNAPFSISRLFSFKAGLMVAQGCAQQIVGIMPLGMIGNKGWTAIEEPPRGSGRLRAKERIELNPRIQFIPHPLSKKEGNNVNGSCMAVVWHRDHKGRTKISWRQWAKSGKR